MITVFDIETSFQIIDKKKDPSFNNPDNFIVSIGINDEYVFFKHRDYKGIPDRKVIQNILDKTTLLVGHNIKFDLLWLWEAGFNYDGKVYDTMVGQYLLQRGVSTSLKLKHCCERRNVHRKSDLTESYMERDISFENIPIKIVDEYGRQDIIATRALFNSQMEDFKLKKNKGLINTVRIMCQFCATLTRMEMNGIKIDSEHLKNLSKNFTDKIKKIEKEIFSLAKKEFNIGSPKQLGEIIYNDLKITKLKRTKKGSLATSASVLEDLSYKGHKFPSLVLDWRQLSKLKNTYTDALQEHVNSKTNRVHTSFLLAATNTGRLASSDPNLQNIPVKTVDGREIRKAFVAEKNNILISADYNQVEMKILADLADVKELKKAFVNKEDIHILTASQVFNVPIKKVDENLRRKAKTINFGIIYGITQYGLAKQISVSNQEALEFINAYFKKFPEIKEYMDKTIKFCRKNGYVNNIFGRRIHLRGINDKNFSVRSFQERAAINAPIQSSAADIIRLAMIKINELEKSKKIHDAKMLLQIHDELVFECLKSNQTVVEKVVKKAMESVSSSEYHMFTIPLDVNINSGNNWEEAH